MQRLKLEDFVNYNYLSQLSYSPDGKHAAFVISNARLEENDYTSCIYIMDTATKAVRKLTSFGKESSYIWDSADTLLFPAMRDENDRKKVAAGEELSCFYRINIQGGEAVKAFSVPLNVKSIQKQGDGSYILGVKFDLNRPDLTGKTEEEKKAIFKQMKEDEDYILFEELPFWSNGAGMVSRTRHRLYTFCEASGVATPITDKYYNVGGWALNEAKDKIVFNGFYNDGFPENPYASVMLYDFNKKEAKMLVEPTIYNYGEADFLGDKVVFTGHLVKREGYMNRIFYTVDLETGKIEELNDFDRRVGQTAGSDARYGGGCIFKAYKGKLYFVTTEDYSAYLCTMDETGKITRLVSDIGSVDFFDVFEDNLLYVALRDIHLQEIYERKIGDTTDTKLTSFNDHILETRSLVMPEYITFVDSDGVEIDGWIYKPVDYDPNKKYPAILDIHGGPNVLHPGLFFHEMQYFANEGYFTFICNPRGSDGKGTEFVDIRGKYGTIDYQDIMEFTDEVIRRYPQIDVDRMGVTGGSYGGYMTNWIIGHTDRFKCAVSQRSIANWVTQWCCTDGGFRCHYTHVDSTPWSNVEKLWEESPLKYADRVKTPTLFIHSNEDYRCWMSEAIQMFTALRWHGVEAKICLFKGENHELSRSGKPKHRVKRLSEMIGWMNKYLK